MTVSVKELIKLLEKYPEDTEVIIDIGLENVPISIKYHEIKSLRYNIADKKLIIG